LHAPLADAAEQGADEGISAGPVVRLVLAGAVHVVDEEPGEES
jgi:hypothetical protein